MQTRRWNGFLALSLAMSFVICSVFLGFYFLFWQGPKELLGTAKDGVIGTANAGYDLLKRAGKDLYKALEFEPKVIVAGEMLYGEAKAIKEIATASETMSYIYTYEATWAGSKKVLQLKGDFIAKAGFKVDEASFYIEISEDAKSLTMHHKKPELLSCELTKIHVLRDEDGWWNKLQAEERESAQNELLRRAKEGALDGDLQEAAMENLWHRLLPLEGKYSFQLKHQLIVP